MIMFTQCHIHFILLSLFVAKFEEYQLFPLAVRITPSFRNLALCCSGVVASVIMTRMSSSACVQEAGERGGGMLSEVRQHNSSYICHCRTNIFSAVRRLKSFLQSTMTQTFMLCCYIYTRKKQTSTLYLMNL